jgi:hypothetical protein
MATLFLAQFCLPTMGSQKPEQFCSYLRRLESRWYGELGSKGGKESLFHHAMKEVRDFLACAVGGYDR